MSTSVGLYIGSIVPELYSNKNYLFSLSLSQDHHEGCRRLIELSIQASEVREALAAAMAMVGTTHP